jgi:glycosyltransferase involved in cell wall biosynthesis
MLFESFAKVMNDNRISEIVIVDDCSDSETWNDICIHIGLLHNDKFKLYRNDKNLGCYHNKREAVNKASNEFVILLDSDNIIDVDYIDCLFNNKQYWNYDRLLQPVFAKPHFNFTLYTGLFISKSIVHEYADQSTFTTALNAMNYFVNRDEFLRIFEDREEPWTADSILINYNWLSAGNSIYFCHGLEYEHRVHDGSHYKEHHRKTGNLFNEIVNKLKAMR